MKAHSKVFLLLPVLILAGCSNEITNQLASDAAIIKSLNGSQQTNLKSGNYVALLPHREGATENYETFIESFDRGNKNFDLEIPLLIITNYKSYEPLNNKTIYNPRLYNKIKSSSTANNVFAFQNHRVIESYNVNVLKNAHQAMSAIIYQYGGYTSSDALITELELFKTISSAKTLQQFIPSSDLAKLKYVIFIGDPDPHCDEEPLFSYLSDIEPPEDCLIILSELFSDKDIDHLSHNFSISSPMTLAEDVFGPKWVDIYNNTYVTKFNIMIMMREGAVIDYVIDFNTCKIRESL